MGETIAAEVVGGCMVVVQGGHEFERVTGDDGDVSHKTGGYGAPSRGFGEITEFEGPILDGVAREVGI